MTSETMAISNTEDILDIRDIIARYEFLEAREDVGQDADSEDPRELALLRSLLDALKGNGGDENWRGDRYPLTLIRDSFFKQFAQELAEDIGAIDTEATWPLNHIDWEAATEALQQDYFAVEFDGETYWIR